MYCDWPALHALKTDSYFEETEVLDLSVMRGDAV